MEKVLVVLSHLKMYQSLCKTGVSGALGFIVIALPASVFINLFSASKISTVVGVYGGELLKSLDITGFPLLIAFVFICTGMNLFITSGSAKWLIIAPVFVPLFQYFRIFLQR